MDSGRPAASQSGGWGFWIGGGSTMMSSKSQRLEWCENRVSEVSDFLPSGYSAPPDSTANGGAVRLMKLNGDGSTSVVDSVSWVKPVPGAYEHPRWRYNVPVPDDEIGLRVHVRPYQRPHPPIAMAGISVDSDTLEFAGERGYIPMSINFAPARVLATHWESVARGAAKTGRTADRADWRIVLRFF